MDSIPPVLPFRIQAAYGQKPSVQPAQAKPAGASKLVAGQVSGKVSFQGDTVELSSGAKQTASTPRDVIPMYRNPAAKNIAATGVQVGRALDVKG